MTKIDLSILKSVPQLSVNAELRIEPLAPLSMVSELPGSFYKAMSRPDKKIICGLIENILGWHIDWRDRKCISKEI
jgi:CRISPR-associated protein Cas5